MTFRADPVSKNVATWTKVLSPWRGQECRAIEIGSYEGRSAIWFCQNILTHPHARLVCVDIHVRPDWGKTFYQNIAEADVCRKVEIHRGRSQVVVRTMHDTFDFAYIDGNHSFLEVLTDSVLVWPMLRAGGVLIWDDYGHRKYPGCTRAIDAFLEGASQECEVIHRSHQMIVRKRESQP